jgi:predicted nucleic acid-binding protein
LAVGQRKKNKKIMDNICINKKRYYICVLKQVAAGLVSILKKKAKLSRFWFEKNGIFLN